MKERKTKSDPFGIHRVLDEHPTLPQAALRLDNQTPIFDNEILIEVEKLNIDAASFVQMEKETASNPEKIGQIILENCRSRGKQQNQVTGSGGHAHWESIPSGKSIPGPFETQERGPRRHTGFTHSHTLAFRPNSQSGFEDPPN
ncbi:hypothetical protein EBQ90_09605 [bacterium]|nr:hypothetical protein [bacterium]